MPRVEIRLEGHLDENWADWLNGFALSHAPSNTTVLTGVVVDQSALFGLLAKLRDLGVKLLAINFGGDTSEGVAVECE